MALANAVLIIIRHKVKLCRYCGIKAQQPKVVHRTAAALRVMQRGQAARMPKDTWEYIHALIIIGIVFLIIEVIFTDDC